jgi:Outer membrane protein beta-barrel family
LGKSKAPTTLLITDTQSSWVITSPRNFIDFSKYGLSLEFKYSKLKWVDHYSGIFLYNSYIQSHFPLVENTNKWGSYLSSNNTFFLKYDKTIASILNVWYQLPELTQMGITSSYYKMDIGASLSVPKKNMQITLVLNDAFRSSANSISTIVAGIKQTYYTFQLNRFLQLSVKYHLGGKSRPKLDDRKNISEEKERVK